MPKVLKVNNAANSYITPLIHQFSIRCASCLFFTAKMVIMKIKKEKDSVDLISSTDFKRPAHTLSNGITSGMIKRWQTISRPKSQRLV